MKATIEEILEDYKQGKMIILMDDEDRENEGDLIIPAATCTKEDINFMATHGRGLICLTLTQGRCKQLNLPLMVAQNNDVNGTNFTVSIEAVEGVTTGISAADRAKTVLDAVAKDATPADIVQPGHIFPLMAQPGGVLIRAGHTEAGCDLARLAGYEPASVIVEILNEDGTTCVRVHMEDTFKDVLHEATPSFGVESALKHIAKSDNGVFLLLRKQTDKSILQNIDSTVRDNGGDDIKTYGVGAQILSDLGVKKMRILGSPRKLHGLKGFGLEVVEYVDTQK